MMFSNHHHPSTATHHHHHSQLLEEVAHLSNANSANHNIAAASATNSNLIMPHFLNDDITYSSSSSNHPPINHQTILMAHHHHFNHNNQYSSLNQSIINQEQFPQLSNHHHSIFNSLLKESPLSLTSHSLASILASTTTTTTAATTTTTSTTTTTIGQIPHQTIFRYSNPHQQSPYSPVSTVISTIGTPPPIHQQQHQSKSPTNRHTAISHSIKSLTKMTNGQSKKITRNDSSSSSSSSSSTMTKSKSNNHHNSNHPQQCKVCGDIPIGKNFGVVTCGSCKIFFSRNIDSKERLQCRNHNRCMDLINKSNRRNCSACRLDKCIRLGMRVKRNRQKQLQQQSLSIGSPSMKILRNPNRSLSESSPSNHNHLININENYHHHHPHHNHEFNDQNSSQAGSSSLGGDDDDEDDDIEINEISSDDYHDIPNLIPMESIANSGQSTLQNEFNYLANHNHNHRSDSYDLINVDCNKSTEKNSMLQQQQQPIRSESIIQLLSHQQQRQQQPLFNSVSVIQQAPPSRPSSSAALIINNNNNNNDNVNSNSNSNDDSLMAEDLDNENDNDDVIEIQDISQSIPANNNNNNDTATFSQQQRQPSTSKSEDINNNEKYDNNNKMLVPFNNNQNRSLIDIVVDDEEDLDSLEQMTHDVFNYSHVQSSSSLNEHTRYNYNNFYEENYCKYYYTPANSNTYHHNDHSNGSNSNSYLDDNEILKPSSTNDDLISENDLTPTSMNRIQNFNYDNNDYDYGNNNHENRSNIASVELCKVEARNFGDQDHALIADLEKWKPYIRIHMGIDYTTTASTSSSSSSSILSSITNITTMIDNQQHHQSNPNHHDQHNYYFHKLFAKEREKIDLLNLSCRMISAKPQSNDQFRAIFNSLERGIFYANKSFKLYEEFWRVSEISELIRQNESGFFKKKNNLLHMLYHLRGVQNFDDNLNAWAIFNGVNDNGFTMIKLDMFQQSIKKEMSVAHRQYIKSFPQEWRKDPTVFNLMTYLLLFSAFDRPHSPFKCDK
nr:GATA zinc finger domain-containing protein 14-like isoform X2 [Dermatophagoides pteronyssinus]